MNIKKNLHLNLNYAHKNLSSAFRIFSSILGTTSLTLGILLILLVNEKSILILLSGFFNIGVGFVFLLLSINFLPPMFRRYFIVTADSITYKTTVLKRKRTYSWKDLLEVEIDKTMLKLQIETEHKPRIIYLGIVSYYDFELLQKAIIDACVEKGIDLK